MISSNHKQQAFRFLHIPVVLCGVLYLATPPAHAANAWQQQQLFAPTEGQLAREQRGAVNIYSGFTDRQVMAALDQQFHRVENMMFIRTVVTDEEGEAKLNKETGKPLTEDDDC